MYRQTMPFPIISWETGKMAIPIILLLSVAKAVYPSAAGNPWAGVRVALPRQIHLTPTSFGRDVMMVDWM